MEKTVCYRCGIEVVKDIEECPKCHMKNPSISFDPSKKKSYGISSDSAFNNLIKCAECGKEVSKSAPTCPHCGIVRIKQDTKKVDKSKSQNGVCFLIVWVVFLIGFLTIFYTCTKSITDSTKSYKPTQTDRQITAYSMAVTFVKNDLKSPSSAVFADFSSETVKEIETNVWLVNSYVDAQNSFGAQIRNYYYVKMSYDSQTDKWALLDIIIK